LTTYLYNQGLQLPLDQILHPTFGFSNLFQETRTLLFNESDITLGLAKRSVEDYYYNGSVLLFTNFLGQRKSSLAAVNTIMALSLVMLTQYFTFYLELTNKARISLPIMSTVAMLAFSNTIFAIIPPVSDVSRSVLLLLLTYAYVFLLFLAQVFITSIGSACSELRKSIKEATYSVVGKEKEDPTKLIYEWNSPDKIALERNKKLKETNPEEIATADPIASSGLAWLYFFVIHPSNVDKFEERVETVNTVCRIVYIILFWVFLIPVFLAPVTVPAQSRFASSSYRHAPAGYTIAAIFAPIIITLLCIFAALFFVFGFGERNKLDNRVKEKVAVQLEKDKTTATKGWKKNQPSKEDKDMKADEYRKSQKARSQLREDIEMVLVSGKLGTFEAIETKPKKEGEKKEKDKDTI